MCSGTTVGRQPRGRRLSLRRRYACRARRRWQFIVQLFPASASQSFDRLVGDLIPLIFAKLRLKAAPANRKLHTAEGEGDRAAEGEGFGDPCSDHIPMVNGRRTGVKSRLGVRECKARLVQMGQFLGKAPPDSS